MSVVGEISTLTTIKTMIMRKPISKPGVVGVGGKWVILVVEQLLWWLGCIFYKWNPTIKLWTFCSHGALINKLLKIIKKNWQRHRVFCFKNLYVYRGNLLFYSLYHFTILVTGICPLKICYFTELYHGGFSRISFSLILLINNM